MPKYRVLRDTLVPATGRIHRAGEEVDIEWPSFGKGHSSEPKRLDDNLELVEVEKPKRGGKGAESGESLV